MRARRTALAQTQVPRWPGTAGPRAFDTDASYRLEEVRLLHAKRRRLHAPRGRQLRRAQVRLRQGEPIRRSLRTGAVCRATQRLVYTRFLNILRSSIREL